MSQQPYDSSIKALFKEEVAELVPLLLPGATFLTMVDGEIIRPTMRTDRTCLVYLEEGEHILQVEFQAGSDDKMEKRLLVYHACLWYDHPLPIISIIVYLFRSTVPTSPLREESGKSELLTFHYQVICMWELDAQDYLRRRDICMYSLLPTMNSVNATMLLQAIDEMVEYYSNESQLAQRLLWMKVFLERTDTVKKSDKEEVEKRLDTLEKLLEESEYVQRQRALGRKEGEIKGKLEGEINGLQAVQQVLVNIVKARFPSLTSLAQERAGAITDIGALKDAATLIIKAPDEEVAAFILKSLDERKTNGK